MGEVVGLPACRVGGEKGCWNGVLVGQSVAVWKFGGVAVATVSGSSHQLKWLWIVMIAWSWALRIADGIGDGIKAVDNGVSWCDSRDSEIVVMEVDCVGDADGLDFGINVTMAAVMLKGGANVDSARATEVPGVVGGWLVVDNDGVVVGRLDMYRTKVLLYRTIVLLACPTKVRR